MLYQNSISPVSFKKWVWQDKENRMLLFLSSAIMALSFIWLKIIYPFPNFMPPDSTNYIEAAERNDFINFWPIGYSKFLIIISKISHSSLFLTAIQYILLTGSILYFLFTIHYLFSLSKWFFRVVLILSIGNPILPHIANFVSSDCLFTALSLLWITQVLWILYRPTYPLILVHSLFLVAAFATRHMALYYPIVSVATVLFSSMRSKRRAFSIALIVLPILAFIGRTQYEYKMKTGFIQYSSFAGWQMAANALYAYAHSNPKRVKMVPVRFRELHKIVNQHMDSLRGIALRPDDNIGIYYLWNRKSPLKIYMDVRDSRDHKKIPFLKWSSVAPLYIDYGKYLISENPLAFSKYFVWPNLLRYYAPPTHFMGNYNMGLQTVDSATMKWFHWSNTKLPIKNTERKIQMANVFSNILPVLNVVFLLFAFVFVGSSSFRGLSLVKKKMIISLIIIWGLYSVISILAAPIELRYELFPLVLEIPFIGLFMGGVLSSIEPVTSKTAQVTFGK